MSERIGLGGGTTKHPPDAPHWKPPPTEVYSADCVEGNSRNFAFWAFSEVAPPLSRPTKQQSSLI